MKPSRYILGGLGLLAAGVLVGPFLAPIKPLLGLVPPKQLADADSRFIELDWGHVPGTSEVPGTSYRLTVHYKTSGSGEPLILLLHGFSANTFSWRKVIQPLSRYGTVVAFDRPSSGLTERPLRGTWTDESPYSPDAQADQVAALIQALGFQQAILIGNSAGGTIAVNTALHYPDRVQALVLVDPAIYVGGGAPDPIKPLLRTPQMDRLGVLISRSLAAQGERLLNLAWHDPAKITPADREGYRQTIRVQDWDRGLWELTLASRDLKLGQRVAEITAPTLVITGDDDRIVPTEQSIRLAGELPNAQLTVISNCGHVPQEECPDAFLTATATFLSQNQAKLRP